MWCVYIECTESAKRFTIVDEALRLGFDRRGVAKTFIHVDIDLDKSPDVIWMY